MRLLLKSLEKLNLHILSGNMDYTHLIHHPPEYKGSGPLPQEYKDAFHHLWLDPAVKGIRSVGDGIGLPEK